MIGIAAMDAALADLVARLENRQLPRLRVYNLFSLALVSFDRL